MSQGPLIDAPALAKVEELVADALAQGARCVAGGQRHALGGTFYEPTILADVTPTMMLASEEIFGPVAPLFRFKTEAEAIALANDTEFGLASYFFSRDLGRVWRVAEALDVRHGRHQHRHHQHGRSRRSAASSNRAWGAKVRATASRTTSTPNTSAWAAL